MTLRSSTGDLMDEATKSYDAGLAAQLAAVTGAEPWEWNRAVEAWRQARWDVDDLRLLAAEGTPADEAEKLATGSFSYAAGGLEDAFRDLGRQLLATMPRWLARLLGVDQLGRTTPVREHADLKRDQAVRDYFADDR